MCWSLLRSYNQLHVASTAEKQEKQDNGNIEYERYSGYKPHQPIMARLCEVFQQIDEVT